MIRDPRGSVPENKLTSSSYTFGNIEISAVHCHLANRFLDEVLLPSIQSGKTFEGPQTILHLHTLFAIEHVGTAIELDLIHVWLVACDRNLQYDRIADQEPERVPEVALDILVAISLLENALFPA